MDQAQHFGALGATAGGMGRGQAGEEFREGLDGTERERKFYMHSSAPRSHQLP